MKLSQIGRRSVIAARLHINWNVLHLSREHRNRESGQLNFLGAAEALREASNSPMTPQEGLEYDNEVASLRAGMDEKTFVSLWAEGRAMPMEQAIEYALQEDLS